MSVPILYVVLAVAALATAAVVAAPLRRATPKLFAAVVLVVPVLAFALYRIVGTPAALDPALAAASAQADAPTMEEAIAELEAALRRDPAQPEGWRLLARAYAAQGERAKSRDAFMRALEQIPDDPELLIETAQARAQAAPGNQFDDEALAQLRRALALDPGNQRALWFIGVVQRQRGDDRAAVETWETLLPALDADTAAALRTQIDQAREAAGMPPLAPAEVASVSADDGAAPGAGLRVRVSLDPEFAARVRLRGDATVFVIARAAGGPPMPVAVERHALQSLPLEVVLDDGDSPMPTAKLSSLREVEVLARISATGSANRSEGDLESAPVRLALPADGPVDLVIGAQAP
ncbi:tetratricopeptide repeat protein [Luteimonas composti]|uniref:Tetratricopeptide repeat protein n=1 Tax=Luteimonas composti TaxID=398257 RepID=A0ABT6MQ41_9GAMM|nr:tetratricopeptide repeat protein [Luteimonas composti]MDH7452751.1 tetratricopeptide repeat protein [Luteimonas composti]